MKGLSGTIGGLLATLSFAACAPKADTAGAATTKAPAADTFSDASTTAQIHAAWLTPGSDALYAAEASPPTTSEGWASVEAGATKVIDGAALLQTGSRPAGRDDWIRIAKAVEAATKKSLDAARAHDADALALADGDFTAQCEDCHKFFRDAGGGMMANPTR
ncbi:MAG: hypothetical protein GC155_16525 [Alphaproteobacteria bacterium]|nr:hypothetical protein [Alphaproteobacteria bacterium]